MNPEPVLPFEALAGRIRAAVESVTAVDPDPLDPFRGLYTTDELALSLAPGIDLPAGVDARLAHAAQRLGLDLLEAAVLGLCAAPELDPRFGRLYGFLQDDMSRRLASPRLVGALLAGEGVFATDVMACLTPGSRLLRLGAVRFLDSAGGPSLPTAERPLKVADRLAALLLGAPLPPREAAGRLRPFDAPAFDPGREEVVTMVREYWRAGGPLAIVVAGPDAPSLLARGVEQSLLLVSAHEAADHALMAEAALVCALEGRALAFDRLDRLDPQDYDALMDALRAREDRPLLVAARRDAVQALADRTILLVAAGPPSFEDRVVAWRDLTSADGVEDVAAKFRLSVEQIAEGAQVAALLARARAGEGAVPTDEELHRGAREASSSRVGELADRLQPDFTWDDLVVPERQLEQLRSISAYLRHRDRVLSDWGYDRRVARTQGLKVLFAGESGTGKTMSAQIIANELGLEIFRVDLATLVSKYIGETEKNLDRIFDAAEGSNAILFFDEADAMFGKRSDVSDAHDRYANLETAYLLQRMEGYEGAVVLATNYRSNIDTAFTRRLDFVIDFPFPEEDDRRRIWETLLPAEAPVDDDVDLAQLANRFKLSGGAIRNCTLAAAFLAAEEGDRIHHRHMVRAVQLEYVKLGRLTGGADFRHEEPVAAAEPEPQSRIPPLTPRRTAISEL